MVIRSGLEQLTHNFRLSFARQRRSWFNVMTPEWRFNAVVGTIVLLCGVVLYLLMGDLEGREALKMSIAFIAGIIGFVLVARSPDSLIGIVFILNATLFGFGAWSQMALKFNVFNTAEVVLGLLLVFAAWEYLKERPHERPKLDAVMMTPLVFYAIVLTQMVAAVMMLERGWDDIWNQYGQMVHYLLILPMIIYLRRQDRLRSFINLLFAMSLACACQTYYFYFFGQYGWGDLFGLVDVSARGSGLAVRLPSAMLMVAMTLISFGLYMHVDDERKKRWYFIAFLAFMVAVAMNKGRNGYVGVLLGTSFIWFFSTKTMRWIAFRDSFWVAVVVATMAVCVPQFGDRLAGVFDEVGIRFTQTFDVREYEEGGYHERMLEVEQAWPRFLAHPAIGQGPGYYLRRSYEPTASGTKRANFQPFMHNSYVYVLATGGVLTTLPLLILLCVPIFVSMRRVRKLREPSARGFIWGGTAYMLAMLAGSWVQPNFFLVAPVTTTAVVIGLTQAISRKDLDEQSNITAAEAIAA
jgi:O-antigen ligase